MLIGQNEYYLPKTVVMMSELAILNASVKSALHDIAKQASVLGTGLQNAAPGDKTGNPNNTIQYLLTMSDLLEKAAEDCDKL